VCHVQAPSDSRAASAVDGDDPCDAGGLTGSVVGHPRRERETAWRKALQRGPENRRKNDVQKVSLPQPWRVGFVSARAAWA